MLHRIAKVSYLLSTIATVTLAAAPALADILYVSTTGKNSNPCTLAQPCRSLQYAIGKTPAGSEIHVLDSGFYGNNATIRRSLTISGNGHTVMLGAPITVNDANAVVTLRRLALNGQGSVQKGVDVLAARAVHIERCVVHGFVGNGIRLFELANAKVSVADTTVRDNNASGLFARATGPVNLTIDNSRIERNGSMGVWVEKAQSTVTRTIISDNNSNGIYADGGTMSVTSSTVAGNNGHGIVGYQAFVVVESVTARDNKDIGLYASAGIIVVSNSIFAKNGKGIVRNSGAVVLTRQNNVVTGNNPNIEGALTPTGGI